MDNGEMNEPSIEEAMAGNVGSTEGFDLFSDDEMEQIKEYNEKLEQQHKEMARAYAAVFSSQQGQKVLEDLLDRTLRDSVYMPERENPEILGHIREGQNSIVRYISQRINQGKQVQQQSKEDGE